MQQPAVGRVMSAVMATPSRQQSIASVQPIGSQRQAAPGGMPLQNFNNDLFSSIEGLRVKREGLRRQIARDEEDKAKLQKELQVLQERLSHLGHSTDKKAKARQEYDKTIQDTEAAYMKILESAQTLLHVLKRETNSLGGDSK